MELWLLRNTNIQFRYIIRSILICREVSLLSINFQITFFIETLETYVWLCYGLQRAVFTQLNVMFYKWKMTEFGVCEIWVSHCGVAEDASILVIFCELLDTEDEGCVIFPKFRNFSPDMTSHPRRCVSSIWVFQGVDAEFGVAENVSRFKLKLLNPWPDATYFGLTDCVCHRQGILRGKRTHQFCDSRVGSSTAAEMKPLALNILPHKTDILCKLRLKLPQKKMACFTCCVERKTSFSI